MEKEFAYRIGVKYRATNKGIVNEKGDLIPPDEPIVLFRAKDTLALRLLLEYETDCCAQKVYGFHIAGIRDMIRDFIYFRARNPARMKLPD